MVSLSFYYRKKKREKMFSNFQKFARMIFFRVTKKGFVLIIIIIFVPMLTVDYVTVRIGNNNKIFTNFNGRLRNCLYF